MTMFFFSFCFDPLHPSQQVFSHVGAGLRGLNQYRVADKVSKGPYYIQIGVILRYIIKGLHCT